MSKRREEAKRRVRKHLKHVKASSETLEEPPLPVNIPESIRSYLEDDDMRSVSVASISNGNYNEDIIIQQTLQDTIKVAGFQVGQGAGLTEDAAIYIATIIKERNIDVLVLSDCKCNATEMAHRSTLFKRHLGGETRCLLNPASPSPSGPTTGGIMIVVHPKWAGAIRKSYSDPSGTGVVSAVDLQADCGQIITVIGT